MLVRNYLELNQCTGVAVVPPCDVAHISRQDGSGPPHIVGLHGSARFLCHFAAAHTVFILQNKILSAWNLVREGGSAHILGCKIRRMERSGVSAYGGGKSLVVEDSFIEDIGVEGVQCLGPRAPNEFQWNALAEEHGFSTREDVPNTPATVVSEAPRAAARGKFESHTSELLYPTLRY